ncbi:T9SS type A sorting domain-containing protein [Subsaximicrobium wynnwilliamsii]|uniref:T9SS type A sorting domain-containing protein n=1 Tax=Subsaximicrobium wynnwilliamsii TaxID=291179 RepID=A0A5C6ZKJ9_9FLAO|nr:T9SS type A sorting domain-containing protein [Subsaximicrobium wynnwilliamsii]TXD84253.1 T9SS type A sorting domain-containing protein [Subsaximicrobium wynnwilliamsii]TXD89874.1 T9SS type A sorting domain-containing protein [Subsaximicrobium wynnwilliamsii]TXE03965.1 T9SS type A sorting domain-containing protein [Subsaximicrobium wynnwilliamsii]
MLKKLLHSVPKMSVFVMIMCCVSLMSAQDEAQCGTLETPESETIFQDMLPRLRNIESNYMQSSMSRTPSSKSFVPIKAHILRRSDGTGGLTQSQLDDAIAEMNVFYANASMEFFICDAINYIDDTDFYDFEPSEEYSLTNSRDVDNVVNIYFANSVASNTGNSLCGYAYYPGGPERILMKNSCTTNGSTLAHEMGHFFSLRHTHGAGTSTNELVNGSNCSASGDYICDTAADPRLGYSNVSSSCVYTGTSTDANNDTYAPDPNNVMSYSRKQCRTLFTQQQYARIQATYQTSRSNLTCPSFNIAFDSDLSMDCSNSLTVNFSDDGVGATAWEWDVNGDGTIDYTTQNPEHTYDAAGKYDVALTISNEQSTTITMTKPEFINVGVNQFETSSIELSLTTDNFPEETTWNFKDGDGNILYSGGPYIEGQDENTIFTQVMNINGSGCYSFEIEDSFGDGICCSEGSGSYELKDTTGNVIISGADYGSGEVTLLSNAVLSTQSFFTTNHIAVFPNPASSVLNVKLSDQTELPDAFKIYNILGQTVLQKAVRSNADLKIDISSLSNGMYFIKLSQSDRLISIPFVKA